MERTKLTVRLPKDLLEEAKRYAREHDTTLTRLLAEYLRRLGMQDDRLSNAPIVRRLSGTLSSDASVKDYYAYLERKHGGQT